MTVDRMCVCAHLAKKRTVITVEPLHCELSLYACFQIKTLQSKLEMVKIGLQICATLENVEELKTCHPEYPFFIKIKCSNCGEESEKWHDLTENERVNEDSRNPEGFHFYAKCKLCNRENSIDILSGTNGGKP